MFTAFVTTPSQKMIETVSPSETTICQPDNRLGPSLRNRRSTRTMRFPYLQIHQTTFASFASASLSHFPGSLVHRRNTPVRMSR